MLIVYKKLEKTLENPNGIIQIQDMKLLRNPFLLCISALKKYADESKQPKQLFKDLDLELSYGNSSKYTQGEAKIRYELDISCRELQRLKKQLESVERIEKQQTKKLSSVVDSIRKYSSDTTFYQILVSAGMWHYQ